jgi:hypothetical protein
MEIKPKSNRFRPFFCPLGVSASLPARHQDEDGWQKKAEIAKRTQFGPLVVKVPQGFPSQIKPKLRIIFYFLPASRLSRDFGSEEFWVLARLERRSMSVSDL